MTSAEAATEEVAAEAAAEDAAEAAAEAAEADTAADVAVEAALEAAAKAEAEAAIGPIPYATALEASSPIETKKLQQGFSCALLKRSKRLRWSSCCPALLKSENFRKIGNSVQPVEKIIGNRNQDPIP